MEVYIIYVSGSHHHKMVLMFITILRNFCVHYMLTTSQQALSQHYPNPYSSERL